MRSLNQRKGSVGIENGHKKKLPHEHMFSLDQEEAVVEELQGNHDELRRTRRNLETLMRI